ncbi:MAG: RNA polymerase sigma factor SigJ [Chloroflexi bacterium]|nr:RNA polymerase sigma factor SigJ [Chloroflexota bacterium]
MQRLKRLEEGEWLAQRFEEHRARLRGVAYRMLGSVTEADDAIQEAWLRLSRSEASDIENLGGWLTTVVARVCLNMLRSRNSRREQPLEPDSDVHVPDPIISRETSFDPEHAALMADSVGLALLVVLETLAPPERLAFVLHDMFGVSFDEIADILGRSSTAARQLASRARRRVQGTPVPDADISAQRKVVDAFFAASRRGDFEGLLAVLDPDIVIRSDGGSRRRNITTILRGAEDVAASALTFRQWAGFIRPALINGVAGAVVIGPNGLPFSVMAFTVRGGRIVEVDAIVDPERLARMDFTVLDD